MVELSLAAVAVGLLQAAAALAPPPEKPTTARPPAPLEELVVTAPPRTEEPPPKYDFDPQGRFGAPSSPYLRRRPVNGCKPMAGGATSPIGKSGVASGLVCAKPF